jgi:hypothetical protein
VTISGADIGQLGPGDHVGEIALIAETPGTAAVTAETDLRCYAMTSNDVVGVPLARRTKPLDRLGAAHVDREEALRNHRARAGPFGAKEA